MLVGALLGLLFVSPFVLIYAALVRWVDRFEPEPIWLLLTAFLYGAIFATVGGGVGSAVAQELTGAVLHLSSSSQGMQAFSATVLAPVFEESFKGAGVAAIALVSAMGLHELDGPLDGVIYGGIIGLGFTLTEDILYVAGAYAQSGLAAFAGLLFVRTVLLGLSHCTFTALTGLGFGVAAASRKPAVKVFAPLLGFGGAMTLHAIHNALPTYFGGAGAVVMILFSWMVNLAFFALVVLLVARDRAIVQRELQSEVGRLLHWKELQQVASYMSLDTRNINVLLAHGWAPFQLRREKQLALVEIAFLKDRRRKGDRGNHLDSKEAKLRAVVAQANRLGVWLGP